MRAVVQRTLTSSVTSEGVETGRAGLGLTVLLGVAQDDDERTRCTWRKRSPTCVFLKTTRER